MKIDICFIYWALLFVSICSSCVLFILVAADLQKGHSSVNKSLDPYLNQEQNTGEVEQSANASEVPSIPVKQIDPVSEEILGSFDDLTTATTTLKPIVESEESLLKPTGFKYTTISEGLSDSGDGVMVTLMEQGVAGPPEPPVQNASSPPPAIQDKGGGAPENATDHPHDDIPSFSEWAKKQIAEAEKNKGENLTAGSNAGLKIRSKNYASTDCGAKVLAANPEAQSAGAVLSTSRDEYILSPCNARIWFIVELCEAIQLQRIEVANFELFSSSPKEFSVHLSDRYPTREWTQAATLTAKDERTIQMFSLPHLPQFAKFIKIELHSHYGTEHYCPVSLFRAYGTSELEVLETVDEVAAVGGNDEEEENEGGSELGEEVRPQNLFGSARDAVLSIVKKAAEVLVVKSQSNTTCKEPNNTSAQTQCVTPGYLMVCHNCTDQFFYKVYHLLCCHQPTLQALLQSPFVSKILLETNICSGIGLEWPVRGAPLPLRPRTSRNRFSPASAYLQALLPKETIAALCNMLAVSHRKVVLNVSRGVNREKPHLETVANENSSQTSTSLPTTMETSESTLPAALETQLPSSVELKETLSSTPLETLDPTVLINPTKTLSEDTELKISKEPTRSLPPEHSIENKTETSQGRDSSSSINVGTSSPTIEIMSSVDTRQVVEEGGKKNKTENETQTAENTTTEDTVGTDSLALESLFSDIEEDTESVAAIKATTSPPPHIQKESVFVRLANRIKALERNMSLSGQYLEELSRRYKRQVEELQRALAGVIEERKASAERETMQAAQLGILAHRVDKLTSAVADLIMERDSWTNKASLIGQHGLIILIEVVVFVTVLCICKWVSGGNLELSPREPPLALPLPPAPLESNCLPKTRKRRPSEEPLRTTELDPDIVVNGIQRKMSKCEARRRKRRRKEKGGEVPVEQGGVVVTIIPAKEGPGTGVGAGAEAASQPKEASGVAPGPAPPVRGDSPAGGTPPPVPSSPPPPPTPQGTSYFRTALWSRRQRTPQQPSSSQETISSSSTQSKPHKKPGPLKKIVKKLF